MNIAEIWQFIVAVLIAIAIILPAAVSSSTLKKRMAKQKDSAMHQKPAKELLKPQPKSGDIVLGKYNGKYVCWDTKRDGHLLCIGGSGSGKSSCFVIPMLMNNPSASVLAVDIKGELYEKSGRIGDKKTILFAPHNHDSFGFNPFFNLSQSSSQQAVYETMQTIVFSLIAVNGSKDAYWGISARNLMLGLMIMHWNRGKHNLIEIIDAILSVPVAEQISEIVNEGCNTSNEYKQLIQFDGMAAETLMSVYSNMANALSWASDENLRWAFSDALDKCSPLSLEEGKSIFLSIPENKLTAYAKPLAMIINLTLDELSTRSESSHKVFIILDELGRIISSGGSMDGLIDASMTLRSRKVSLFLVVQQIEALEAGFSKPNVVTLVGNCQLKIILDASSSQTQKTVCEDWVPQYIESKPSKSTGNKNNSNSSSFDYKNRIVPSDLMALIQKKEVVVITPLGYSMIKKCPYYADKYYKKIGGKRNARNE